MRVLLLRGFILLSVIIPMLILNACGTKQQAQDDCGFVQNVYGQRISWKTEAPISLYVHESFPDNMLPALQAAMDNWAKVLGRPVFRIVQTKYQSLGPAQDGVSVIYWMDTWEEKKATEQARTSVYWQGDQITEADIRINHKNFQFFTQLPGKLGEVHLESLLIHELGHVFGLKHKDDSGSVMGTYLASQTVRTKVAAADLKDLKCEYM